MTTSLIKRSPFAPLDYFKGNFIDGLLEELHSKDKTCPFAKSEIKDSDNEIEINIELPGVCEKDINISFDDGVLSVYGEKKDGTKEVKAGKVISQERYYGSFSKTWELPTNIIQETISASLKNGVLSITIPKETKKLSAKKIDIKVS